MTEERRCTACGGTIPPAGLVAGSCPRCLLELALPNGGALDPGAPRPSTECPERIGPYVILSLLGEGGMGIVYLADQQAPIRRRVALKLIKVGLDTHEVIARFEAERQALALMSHPNIARVFDAGVTETGRPYFVMEHVAGVPITQHCDDRRLGIRERLDLFVLTCRAVHHAHTKGIVHRDIKPSNVLVALEDGHPVPKVIDFGVAKATNLRDAERTLYTRQGLMIGTPEYMSPEQADPGGLDVDATTDIYSLGVLLYELLVGALPFDPTRLREAGYDEIRRILRDEEPPRPSTRMGTLGDEGGEVARRRRMEIGALSRRLRGELDWITLKALEKDRARRYASATELAADLVRHLSDEPVEAGPPSAAYRLRKLVRRHRGLAAGVAAVLATLVIGLGASTGLYIRAEASRRDADRRRIEALRRTYVANVYAAQASLRAADFGEACRRLDASEPALRGWEWSHLFLESDTSLATLYAPGDRGDRQNTPLVVNTLAFSSAGERLFLKKASALYGWDVRTSLPVLKILSEGTLLAVDAHASRAVESVSSEATGPALRVLDLATGRPVLALDTGGAGFECAAFSLDGRLVAAGSSRGRLCVWDARTGKRSSVLKEGGEEVSFVLFDPAGTHLAAVEDRRVRSWDLRSRRVAVVLEGHGEPVNSIAFSPDGARVATLSTDGDVRLWDAASGRPVHLLRDHAGQARAACFSPDGRRLVTGGWDKIVRVWDVVGGKLERRLVGHDGPVRAVLFSADGSRIVTAQPGGLFRGHPGATVRIWDARRSRARESHRVHATRVESLAFLPDGERIASGADGGSIEVEDLTGDHRLNLRESAWGRIEALSPSPDGSLLAVGTGEKGVLLLDPSTLRIVRALEGSGPAITAVAFSPDGTRLVSGTREGRLSVYEVASGRELAGTRLDGYLGPIAFTSDGSRVLVHHEGSAKGPRRGHAVSTLDSRTARVLERCEIADCGWNAAFSLDGSRLASASLETVGVWDTRSGLLLATLRHEWPVIALSFSPDGSRLLTGTYDGLRFWNSTSFELLLNLPGCCADGVWISKTAWSDRGGRIAAGCEDGTVGIWNSRSAYVPGAESTVAALFGRLGYAAKVVEALDEDRSLDPELRAAALGIARARGDDPRALREMSWKTSLSPSEGLQEYHSALHDAERACALAPWDLDMLQTLGLALSRVGRQREAIETLGRAIAQRGSKQSPFDHLFLAMALARNGSPSGAREELARTRRLIRESWFMRQLEFEPSMREVEALLEEKAAPVNVR